MAGESDDESDDSLRGMRAVWLSMRESDAEPSGRGMADLLAAARAQVATRAPAREPLWKRMAAAVAEALRRPPVLALASVVVVASAAVLVHSHGGAKLVEPAVPVVRAPADPVIQLAAPPVARVVPTPPMSKTVAAPDGAFAANVAAPTPVAPRRGPSTDQQLRAGQAAAARGDCATVRTVAAALRTQDADFYRSTVARDADIAKCLASSSAE